MLRILDSRRGASPAEILASNDLTAIGAMGAISERESAPMPEDISVIGFDNIQLSAFTQPPLTTVSLPRGEIAKAAFQALLHSREKGSNKPLIGKKYVVQPSMVLRSSTAPAPQGPPETTSSR